MGANLNIVELGKLASPVGNIFSASGVMTGTNKIVGPIIDTAALKRLSIELVWTGNPTGTFGWEQSNMYDAATNPNATFQPVQPSDISPAFTNPAGSAGTQINGLLSNSLGTRFPRYLRPTYTNATGSGVLTGWIFGCGGP